MLLLLLPDIGNEIKTDRIPSAGEIIGGFRVYGRWM